MVYRVAAGPVPDGHWYHDRRQGGRVLGEVCHFVDTAQALVGAPIEDVTALPGGGGAGVVHGDDVAVTLRFADGSLAVVAYGSADPLAGKESIRVPAAARRVVINDFRSAEADGKTIWKGRPGQGTPSVRRGVPPGDNGWGGPAYRGHAGHNARHHPGRGRGGWSWLSGRWTTRGKYSCSLTPRRAVGPPSTRRMRRLARRLTQLADAIGYHVPTRGRVPDLGCGTGKLAWHLAGAGLRVTGCDISADMLGQAAAADPRPPPGGSISPLTGGRCRLQQPASNTVLAASVLAYVDSPTAVLHESPGCCGRVASCCARSPTPGTGFAGWSGWSVPRLRCHRSGPSPKGDPGLTATWRTCGSLPVIVGMFLFGCGIRLRTKLSIYAPILTRHFFSSFSPQPGDIGTRLDHALGGHPGSVLLWLLTVALIFRGRQKLT